MIRYRIGKGGEGFVAGDTFDEIARETRAMGQFAIGRGIPREVILPDDAGFSTYDSCNRAKEVFGVTRAILVTQRFQLSRALFLANSLGIDADGAATDHSPVGPAHE